ncbi:MAG: hypothetical protein ACREL9_07815 [Gemmatimonadales bacterium]
MIERRTAPKLIRFRPENAQDMLPALSARASAAEMEPLMTAADVGHVLQLPRERVYDVLGHLALQIAPHTLRWRSADNVALIEERRRSK